MSRSHRIIASIIGIAIVGLALLGFTYGYFLSKIIGNSSEKSILGELQKLELTYDDQNSTITALDIKPGDTAGTKTFTVKNSSNEQISYSVVLENVTNTLKRKSDLVYTLTCSSGCNGVTTETPFPTGDGIIVTNTIDKSETQTYRLTIKYKNFDNIEVDVGAEFGAKVNIVDPLHYNPYNKNTNTLAYKIVNNAIKAANNKENTTSSKFVTTPETVPAREKSLTDEKELSITPDKYGTSYYYRGSVEDNYITFASMCWRIVRIQGDGSIKLILEDNGGGCSSNTKKGENSFISTSNYSYGIKSVNPNLVDYKNCSYSASAKKECARTNLQNWFNSKFTSSSSSQVAPSDSPPTLKTDYKDKLKYEEWEIGDWTTKYNSDGTVYTGTVNKWYYEPYVRLKGESTTAETSLLPSMSTYNETVNDYVALLTADEFVFAGGIDSSNNIFYLSSISHNWWLLSPASRDTNFDTAFVTTSNSERLAVNNVNSNATFALRPSIILSPMVVANGEGTKTNPYKVS